jgi:hypothetical protein
VTLDTLTTPARRKFRKELGLKLAMLLNGVIAILAALIAVQPGEISTSDGVIGGLLVGAVAMLTRFFIEVTKRETEFGRKADWALRVSIVRDSLPILIFPAVAALSLLGMALAGIGQSLAYKIIYGLGLLTLAGAGFMSRYVADAHIVNACIRGAMWVLLGLIVIALRALM